MKKYLRVLAATIILALIFSACSSTEKPEPSTNPTTYVKENVTIIEPPVKETEAPEVPLSDSGALGEFEVSIGDLEYIQDYEGNPAILIPFTFTNNSEESQSASFSIDCKAFQNGVGLEDAIVRDESIHDSSDLMKKIQPGTTIELSEIYILSSDTAPVEFYVCELISWEDTKIGRIFEIAPGGTTTFSVAPGLESAVKIGRFAVSLNSYNFAEDYEGNKALILNMGYTNNSNTDTPFYAAIDVTAYQDGIELEKAHFIGDEVMDDSNNYLNVLPGAGLGVAEAFVLTSETAPVDIEITETFSFDSDKIETQISIED